MRYALQFQGYKLQLSIFSLNLKVKIMIYKYAHILISFALFPILPKHHYVGTKVYRIQ